MATVQKYITFVPTNAEIAQLVEHQLPKLRVASSNLVFRSADPKPALKAGFIVSSHNHKTTNRTQKRHLRFRRCLSSNLVEVRGVEPLTPCMPCKCSGQLSYTPSVLIAVQRYNFFTVSPNKKAKIFFIKIQTHHFQPIKPIKNNYKQKNA